MLVFLFINAWLSFLLLTQLPFELHLAIVLGSISALGTRSLPFQKIISCKSWNAHELYLHYLARHYIVASSLAFNGNRELSPFYVQFHQPLRAGITSTGITSTSLAFGSCFPWDVSRYSPRSGSPHASCIIVLHRLGISSGPSWPLGRIIWSNPSLWILSSAIFSSES